MQPAASAGATFHVLGGELQDHLLHLADEFRIERRGNLVEQHQLRIEHQCAGDGDALLLAAGKLCRIGIGLGAEPEALEQRLGAGRGLRLAFSAHLAGRENQVLNDAQMRKQRVVLKDHGYTYSGHPVACAAGLATLEIYEEEGLLTRAADLAEHWQEALHSLKGLPNVVDIRNLGLVGAVELAPRNGAPGTRAYDVFVDGFNKGLLIRVTGDIIALSPPLIIEKSQIDTIVSTIGDALKRVV